MGTLQCPLLTQSGIELDQRPRPVVYLSYSPSLVRSCCAVLSVYAFVITRLEGKWKMSQNHRDFRVLALGKFR
jgi:predicted FMN-binding regulatory protein PaiB